MSQTILDMRNIRKCFGPVKALSGVNLKVGDGEIHAICGENGAGKSTLMKILSGVYPHGSFEGEIHFDGSPRCFQDLRDSEALGSASFIRNWRWCRCCRSPKTCFWVMRSLATV